MYLFSFFLSFLSSSHPCSCTYFRSFSFVLYYCCFYSRTYSYRSFMFIPYFIFSYSRSFQLSSSRIAIGSRVCLGFRTSPRSPSRSRMLFLCLLFFSFFSFSLSFLFSCLFAFSLFISFLILFSIFLFVILFSLLDSQLL